MLAVWVGMKYFAGYRNTSVCKLGRWFAGIFATTRPTSVAAAPKLKTPRPLLRATFQATSQARKGECHAT